MDKEGTRRATGAFALLFLGFVEKGVQKKWKQYKTNYKAQGIWQGQSTDINLTGSRVSELCFKLQPTFMAVHIYPSKICNVSHDHVDLKGYLSTRSDSVHKLSEK
jgi:hypothetical protein